MLIHFHRFLIFVAIIFGAVLTKRLFTEYQRLELTQDAVGAAVGAIVTLALLVYLPRVKTGRAPSR